MKKNKTKKQITDSKSINLSQIYRRYKNVLHKNTKKRIFCSDVFDRRFVYDVG